MTQMMFHTEGPSRDTMASTKIMTEHSSIHGTMRSMEPNTVFIPTERRSTRPSESITA